MDNEKEYSRYMSDFRGIDATSDSSQVSPKRFASARNIYKDYKSGQGTAIETFPGTRTLADFGDTIWGMHSHKDENNEIWVVVHAGTNLFRFKLSDRDEISSKTPIYTNMNERKSSSFVNNNKLYIIDGRNYLEVDKDGAVKRIMTADGVDQIAYIPTTYSDGKEYEQRNMLTNKFKEKTHVISLEEDLLKFPDLETSGARYVNIDGVAYIEFFVNEEESGSVTGRVVLSEYVISHNYDADKYELTPANSDAYAAVTSKTFNSSVIEIKGDLQKFTNLTEVNLSNYITELADNFFKGTKIEEVRLPKKLTKLGLGAFEDCDKLKTIYASDKDIITPTYEGAPTSMYKLLTSSAAVLYGVRDGVEVKAYESDYIVRYDAIKGNNIIYIYTPCEEITSVYLDDTELKDMTRISITEDFSVPVYQPLYKTISGKSYIVAIRLYSTVRTSPANITINAVAHSSAFKSATQAVISSMPIEDIEDKSIFGNHDYSGSAQEAISNCTVCCTHDDRTFFTGNPYLPNTVFYTQRDLTGYNNATYIGALNWFDDGVSGEPNVAMMSNATTLMVLKGNTIQDGSIYYHVGADGGSDLVPRIYPSTEGLAGLGCVGLAVNFRDDCVFLSKQGLEGVSKQSVNLERTIAHRSTNIDGLMLQYNLSEAKAAEWEGYLCILINGAMFLADSRQMFEGINGVEYEWYFVNPVGAYSGDHQKYILADWYPDEIAEALASYGIELSDAEDRSVNYQDIKSFSTETDTIYYVEMDGKKYLVDSNGEREGGSLDAACEIFAVDDVLFLGTFEGKILCVNTDKREKDGNIPTKYYNNSGHAYDSVAVLAMENAGVPHYTKTTVKRGTVLRLKTFPSSSINVYATTDRQSTTLLTKQSNSKTEFDEVDFANLGLLTTNSGILAIKEKTKKWVEKQYRIVGNEHNKPWGFYSITYRYIISGEVKNK